MSYTQEDADRAAEVMRAASLSCAEMAEALRKAGMGAATAGSAFAALQSVAAREMARIEREVRDGQEVEITTHSDTRRTFKDLGTGKERDGGPLPTMEGE